jgi:hypothetical protein
MIMTDWSKLLLPYENKYVALSLDEKAVLASGDTLQEVSKIVEERKLKARYMKVPRFDCVYALQCQR